MFLRNTQLAMLACFFAVHAVAMPGVLPTATVAPLVLDPKGWTPKPTEPAELRKRSLWERYDSFGLFKRQDSFGDICGYDWGDPDLPLGCGKGFVCVTSSGAGENYLGCCPTTNTNCLIPTTCLEGPLPKSSAVDAAQSLYCPPNAVANVCQTHTLLYIFKTKLPPHTMVGCAVQNGLPTVYDLASSVTGVSLSRFVSSSFRVELYSVSPLAPVVPDYSLSYTHSTSSSLPSPGPTQPTSSGSSSSSTPIGPIVGGVVGGVVVIAIIIGFVIFFLRKKKKAKKQSQSGMAGYESRSDTGYMYGPPQGGQPQMNYSQPHLSQPSLPHQYPMGGSPSAQYDHRGSYFSATSPAFSSSTPNSPPLPGAHGSEGVKSPAISELAAPVRAPEVHEMGADNPVVPKEPNTAAQEMS